MTRIKSVLVVKRNEAINAVEDVIVKVLDPRVYEELERVLPTPASREAAVSLARMIDNSSAINPSDTLLRELGSTCSEDLAYALIGIAKKSKEC